MAFVHGKNAYFALGSAGSETTTVDLSAYFNDVSFSQDIDTAETSAFGTQAKTYVIGLQGATISLSGMHDPTADAQIVAALGNETALDFDYSPEGNNSGDVLYSGSCFITSYEVSSPVGDMVATSLELQITGAVTRSTV